MKEKKNTLHTIKRRKDSWIGHILSRNCRLKHITAEKTEGEIEVRETQRRIRKQLLDDHKKTRILVTERGSTRSHSAENALWKTIELS